MKDLYMSGAARQHSALGRLHLSTTENQLRQSLYDPRTELFTQSFIYITLFTCHSLVMTKSTFPTICLWYKCVKIIHQILNLLEMIKVQMFWNSNFITSLMQNVGEPSAMSSWMFLPLSSLMTFFSLSSSASIPTLLRIFLISAADGLSLPPRTDSRYAAT